MIRLLFDQNLSHRLVAALADLFPDCVHVRDVGLSRADDATVWAYARDEGLTIVTKDGDFHQMSFLYGPPPKVVWLRAANCTTDQVVALMRQEAVTIVEFARRSGEAMIVIDAGRSP